MAGFSNSITIAFFFLASVIAGPVEPGITPAPHVRRNDPNLVGWYADGVVSGSTIWSPEQCSVGYTLFSAGDYFKCCSTVGACSLYTGCSGSYLLGQNTKANWCCAFPADLGSSYPTCSYDLLYPSSGALTAATYFWCATVGEPGTFFYAASPTATSAAPSSTTSISTTTSHGPTSTSTSTSSSDAGAIAGGVVGGLALIAIIVSLIVFLIIRNRKQQQVQPSTTPPPAGPHPQTNIPAAATMGAVYSSQTEKIGAQGPPPPVQPYYPSGVPQTKYAVSPPPPNVIELESVSPSRWPHPSS